MRLEGEKGKRKLRRAVELRGSWAITHREENPRKMQSVLLFGVDT